MKQIIKVFIILISLSSCISSPSEMKEQVSLSSKLQGFSNKTYNTNNFKIFSLQKISDNSSPINIYIEGDGRAWLSKRVVSPNPTPRNLFLVNLAQSDNSLNVIYFARPCQFVEDDKCSKQYWTTDRFSQPVIDSYREILSQYKDRDINFIAYSGGAAVAILLASEMDNVRSIKTIAGNLDYKAFAEYHKVTPLKDEMDIDSAIKKISNITQTHYMGGKDEVITDAVFNSFKNKIENFESNSGHIKFITVPHATHTKGWDKLLKPKFLN